MGLDDINGEIKRNQFGQKMVKQDSCGSEAAGV